MAIACSKCGTKQGFAATFSVDLGGAPFVCPSCADAERAEREAAQAKSADDAKARLALIAAAAKKVIVTTTPKVDGYYVTAYIGIESVEFVIGTAAFSEISSSIADFFGARSTAFEKKLQAAKKHAMNALKFAAAEQGANAVIGVDLDYSEFSGNRVAIIINGTLVKLAPVVAK